MWKNESLLSTWYLPIGVNSDVNFRENFQKVRNDESFKINFHIHFLSDVSLCILQYYSVFNLHNYAQN